jgi:hypothetical protein
MLEKGARITLPRTVNWGGISGVEHSLSTHEALSSIPSTALHKHTKHELFLAFCINIFRLRLTTANRNSEIKIADGSERGYCVHILSFVDWGLNSVYIFLYSIL